MSNLPGDMGHPAGRHLKPFGIGNPFQNRIGIAARLLECPDDQFDSVHRRLRIGTASALILVAQVRVNGETMADSWQISNFLRDFWLAVAFVTEFVDVTICQIKMPAYTLISNLEKI